MKMIARQLMIGVGLLVLECLSFGTDLPKISISVKPDPVYVERSAGNQYLVFSFELLNNSSAPVQIKHIHMRAFDQKGRLLSWDKLDSNGGRPSIEVLGPRTLEPGRPLTVFNPFSEIEAAVPIDHLNFEFGVAGSGEKGSTLSVDVQPLEYQQKTKLILPVAGAAVWAYEGAGFYSHHSRVDLADPFTREVLKMHHNGERYALDLVVVDKNGEAFHGDLEKKENWVGFDYPIVAPAAGTVVETENNQPDEMPFDETLAAKDPKVFMGNYIVIDHRNGEYSALGHFKRGTLTVKAGDQVKQGQVIGHMGRSGMGSGLIHVHYQLQNSSDALDSEGLPTRFTGFRQMGSGALQEGRINPGWVIVTERVAGTPH